MSVANELPITRLAAELNGESNWGGKTGELIMGNE